MAHGKKYGRKRVKWKEQRKISVFLMGAFRGGFLYFPSQEYVDQVISEMKRVTKNGIFIGELPTVSHDSKHMLYNEDQFHAYGFKTMRGWSEPYCDIRFNALLGGK